MIPIKILCGCGQKYAFDVEPVDGRINVSVQCPACGADGTATTADNDYVAKSLNSQTIAAGQQTYHFLVTVNGDTTVEANETMFVNLTNVTGATVTKRSATDAISASTRLLAGPAAATRT